MADFTVVNEDATLLVWEAADVWNIAIVNYPTTRCSSGHRRCSGSCTTSRRRRRAAGSGTRCRKPHQHSRNLQHTETVTVLKLWKSARAELMKHTLQSLTAAKVSGAKLDTDPPVSFGNIKPDNLIRLFNYGDTLHCGDKRQELVSLREDGFEEAYFRYGALISILGLSQLYFGFAVLVDAALGGVP